MRLGAVHLRISIIFISIYNLALYLIALSRTQILQDNVAYFDPWKAQ